MPRGGPRPNAGRKPTLLAVPCDTHDTDPCPSPSGCVNRRRRAGLEVPSRTPSEDPLWRGYFWGDLAEFLSDYENHAEISTAAIQAQPDAARIWAIRDEIVAECERRSRAAPRRFLEAYEKVKL